jgi:ribosomal protein L40E
MIIYVCRNGVEIGQYTRQDFEYLLSQDRLFPTDHFWSEGMDEWKLLTAAKGYFCQSEKCRHCGAKMSEPKPVTSGARIGQVKTICRKCGHAEYHPVAEAHGEAEYAPESEPFAEPVPEVVAEE